MLTSIGFIRKHKWRVFFSVLWVVALVLYVSTIRWVFTVTHHPQIRTGTRWNNFWLVSGSFAWSRYDPSQSTYTLTYSPPALRCRVHVDRSGYWYWWFWHGKQAGGWFIRIPLWVPVSGLTVLGPAPLFISLMHQRRRRIRQSIGLCSDCGYPRESEFDHCPECGQSWESA